MDPNLLLAQLAGVVDAPLRDLRRLAGPGLADEADGLEGDSIGKFQFEFQTRLVSPGILNDLNTETNSEAAACVRGSVKLLHIVPRYANQVHAYWENI